MAELPEITKFSGQMKRELCGKKVQTITLLQPKCANVDENEFQRRTQGATIVDVAHKGKWIITSLNNGENIVLSLGMGADMLLLDKLGPEPEKYQIKVVFADQSGLTIRFWWFGKFLLMSNGELALDSNTKDIAIDPFDERFTAEYFSDLLKGKSTQVKAFLMNQRNVGGIGNMYMHDILFKARLHPQGKISELDEQQVQNLYQAIVDVLDLSRSLGAFSYEKDLFGQGGGYGTEHFLVGYRDGKPCPVCGQTIVTVKTGSTTSYICPNCQKR